MIPIIKMHLNATGYWRFNKLVDRIDVQKCLGFPASILCILSMFYMIFNSGWTNSLSIAEGICFMVSGFIFGGFLGFLWIQFRILKVYKILRKYRVNTYIK